MRRREILTLLTGAVVGWPVAAQGQSTRKVWRLGWLSEGDRLLAQGLGAFFAALQDLGYTEGQNLTVEYRFANLRYERLPELATELVGLKLDVIVAPSTQALRALQQATSTIPIVMVFPGDPVGAGLVKSLAYPGANITGTSLMYPDIGGKRLELLKEIVPTMGRVVIFGNSKNAPSTFSTKASPIRVTASNR